MELNWQLILDHLFHLGLAFLLAMPVAFNREREERGAGVRTFPLVSIAACAYMLVGMDVFEGLEPEARIMYGIITGIGFIGGGAILKNDNQVMGTATAASIWNTGAIGVSVAYNRYEIAILLSVLNLIILQYAKPLKQR